MPGFGIQIGFVAKRRRRRELKEATNAEGPVARYLTFQFLKLAQFTWERNFGFGKTGNKGNVTLRGIECLSP